MTSVQDPVINTSASATQVTSAVVIVSVLVVLVLLNIILYVIIHKKMNKCLENLRKKIQKKKAKVPKVTVMTVKPVKTEHNESGYINQNRDKYVELSETESGPEEEEDPERLGIDKGDGICIQNTDILEGKQRGNNIVEIHENVNNDKNIERNFQLNQSTGDNIHSEIQNTENLTCQEKLHQNSQNKSGKPVKGELVMLAEGDYTSKDQNNQKRKMGKSLRENCSTDTQGVSVKDKNDGKIWPKCENNSESMTVTMPVLQEMPLQEFQEYTSADVTCPDNKESEHKV